MTKSNNFLSGFHSCMKYNFFEFFEVGIFLPFFKKYARNLDISITYKSKLVKINMNKANRFSSIEIYNNKAERTGRSRNCIKRLKFIFCINLMQK